MCKYRQLETKLMYIYMYNMYVRIYMYVTKCIV